MRSDEFVHPPHQCTFVSRQLVDERQACLEPGKLVGVVFKTPIDGGDTLDGRVPAGHGKWVHPDHVCTPDAFAAAQADAAAWSEGVIEARSIADAFISG